MKRKEAEETLNYYESGMTFEEWDNKYHIVEIGESFPPEGEDGYLWTKLGLDDFNIIQVGVWGFNSLCWYRTEFPSDGTEGIITTSSFEEEKKEFLSGLED
jgi:hypothetical protein